MDEATIKNYLSVNNAPQGDVKKDLKTALYLVSCEQKIDLNNYLSISSLGFLLGSVGYKGDISKLSFDDFKRTLNELVQDGLLQELSPNLYIRINTENKDLKSILKFEDALNNEQFYYVNSAKGQRIIVDILNFKVMAGDEVLVTLTGDNKGCIKEILSTRQYVLGRLMSLSNPNMPTYKLMVDEHSLKNFNFVFDEAKDIKNAKLGDVIIAKIVERKGFTIKVETHEVVHSLGDLDEYILDAVVANDIPNLWPSGMKKALLSVPTTVSPDEAAIRVDLRQLPLVTIDGEDARDFDDAVYTKKEGDKWRLYVAIADVSYYVKTNTLLDKEAINRCNSVYFPNYVIPMLPEKLSNGICSLNPAVDRLCMVCEMIINKEGKIEEYKFYPAVMNSHARLTYTEAYQMISTSTAIYKEHEERIEDIKELHRLYKALYKARINRGAVNAESEEVHFIFNEKLAITGIEPVIRNDAHMLIEECMIAANVCAANFVLAHHNAHTLFRVHAKPPLNKLTALQASLRGLKLALPGGFEPSSQDYANFLRKTQNRADSKFISELILRSMSKAEYSPDNIGHFGLALENYAHFTSPIRRYPDLQLHRVIKYLLKKDGVPGCDKIGERTYAKEELIALGQKCTDREIAAANAEFEVDNKLKCKYVKNFVGYTVTGIVSSVCSFGLFVHLDKFYISGLIHVSNLDNGGFVDYDERDNTLLVGKKKSFKVGDKVLVTIAAVNEDDLKIDLLLASKKKVKELGSKGDELSALEANQNPIKPDEIRKSLQNSSLDKVFSSINKRKKITKEQQDELIANNSSSFINIIKSKN